MLSISSTLEKANQVHRVEMFIVLMITISRACITYLQVARLQRYWTSTNWSVS